MRADPESFRNAIERCLPAALKGSIRYSLHPETNDYVIAYNGGLLHAIVGALSIDQPGSFNAAAFYYPSGDYRSIAIKASHCDWLALIKAKQAKIEKIFHRFYIQEFTELSSDGFLDPFVAVFLARYPEEFDMDKVGKSFDLLFSELCIQSTLHTSELSIVGRIAEYVRELEGVAPAKKAIFEKLARLVDLGVLTIDGLNKLLGAEDVDMNALFSVAGRRLWGNVGRAQHLIEDLYEALGVPNPDMAKITDKRFPNPRNYEFILTNEAGRTVRFTYAALEAVIPYHDFSYTQYTLV